MLPTPLDLLGRWRLERSIEDRYAGARLRVAGSAVLERTDDGRVRWHEDGLLERPGAEPTPVFRTLFAVPAPGRDGWAVTFEDGRPFHAWTPGAPVDHPCAADHYRGVVDVEEPDRWRVTWEVQGPTKDHTITSRYLAVPTGAAS